MTTAGNDRHSGNVNRLNLHGDYNTRKGKTQMNDNVFVHEHTRRNGTTGGSRGYDIRISVVSRQRIIRFGFLQTVFDKVGHSKKYVEISNPLLSDGKIYFRFLDEPSAYSYTIQSGRARCTFMSPSGEERKAFEKIYAGRVFLLNADDSGFFIDGR